MPLKESLPPRDGWIRTLPKQGVNFDGRIQDIWIGKARDLRRMRGDILAEAFRFEYVLDEVIAEVFFPGLSVLPADDAAGPELDALASATMLKQAFVTVFIKASNSSLGRKVDVFNKLAREIRMFGNLVADQLKAEVASVVEVRNMFAHFPFYFEVTGEAPNQDLAAIFLGRAGKIELTNDLCNEYKNRIATTSNNLEEVLGRLRETRSRVDVGEEVNLGGLIWVGHVGLDRDDWKVANPDQPINAEEIMLFATKANLKIDIKWPDGEQESDIQSKD